MCGEGGEKVYSFPSGWTKCQTSTSCKASAKYAREVLGFRVGGVEGDLPRDLSSTRCITVLKSLPTKRSVCKYGDRCEFNLWKKSLLGEFGAYFVTHKQAKKKHKDRDSMRPSSSLLTDVTLYCTCLCRRISTPTFLLTETYYTLPTHNFCIWWKSSVGKWVSLGVASGVVQTCIYLGNPAL